MLISDNIEIIIETPEEVLPRRSRRKRGLVSDETPPAKKIALAYMEPEQLIVDCTKKTRGRRNKK